MPIKKKIIIIKGKNKNKEEEEEEEGERCTFRQMRCVFWNILMALEMLACSLTGHFRCHKAQMHDIALS
jgi:hypothetical protein